MGQTGGSDRSREALRAAEVRGSASAVGGRAHLLLVGSEPPYEQGLRAFGCHERSVHLRCDESLDGETFSSLMKLFRQFRRGILRSSPKRRSAKLASTECSEEEPGPKVPGSCAPRSSYYSLPS